uniref:Programmed cell death 11 n=1 Tax=Gadus morhua TaxID=8049 RepID=A0A8C4Z1T6_GADMO
HVQPETKKRKGGSKEDSTTAKKKKSASDPVTLNAPAKYVEILHLKNIKEGMLMLACVKEVADFDVVMSLPCGLLGFLQIKNISDGYTKLLSEQLRSQGTEEISSLDRVFRPGMLVRCVVLKLDITKGGALSIKLSINPKLLNKALRPGTLRPGMTLSGCVESVEDHGYLVDIGVGETKAFLPRQVATDQNPNPEELRAGQTITCRVDEVKGSGRVVRLSVNPLALARTFADASHDWSLTSLQPGLLVKAKVKTVTKHGLLLSFLSFSGQVDFLHMEPEEESTYTVGQEVQACVLYIEPVTRLVALSLRRHLLAPGSLVDLAPAGGDRIGEVVDGCRVTSMHNMSGALLELPDQTRAFTAQTSALDKLLSLPELSCRILNFSAMEQVHFASLRKYVFIPPLGTVGDPIYMCYTRIVDSGTVSELLDHGMMVQLSGNLKGLVPKTHLSDIVLRNPEKKYSAGMKIKCRVLSVEVDKRRVTLTRKKALLTSTLPVVSSYAAARPGLVAHGFVVSIQSFGCIVRFYNEVKGLVPLRELSTEPLASPEEVFYVGQVVKVKVLECEPEKERLLLSFKAVVEGDTCVPCLTLCVWGSLQRCEARLVTKSAVCLEVAILPEEVPALLPTMHLSDHVSNCALLWEALEEGDVISNLVCLSRNKESITLTQKPLVRWGLEEGLFVKGFSDLAVGMTLVGWIKKLMPYGVFVEFPCGIMGLAPKSALCDRFVTDTASVYQLGQTVVAMVTTFDEEKQRFLVTLKGSEVTDPEGGAQALLLRGLRERRSAEEVLRTTLLVKLDVHVLSVPGVTLTPGQKVTAVVLQVDLLSARVHVSVLPKLLAKKKSLEAGSLLAVMVQHVDQAFAVVAFESSARLAVVHAACHINAVFSEAGHLKPGSALSVTVTDPACAELRGLPLLRVEPGASRHPAPAPRAATTSESEASPGHTYGKTLEGAVRSVKPTCVLVALDGGGTGSVHVSQMADTVAIGSFPTALLEKGARVRARVIGGREGTSHRILLSYMLKFSLQPDSNRWGGGGVHSECFSKRPTPAITGSTTRSTGMSQNLPVRPLSPPAGRQQLAVGVVTLGMVTNIEPGRGLLVRLPSDATGTVSMTQLTDCYRKDPLKAFSKDQVLRWVYGSTGGLWVELCLLLYWRPLGGALGGAVYCSTGGLWVELCLLLYRRPLGGALSTALLEPQKKSKQQQEQEQKEEEKALARREVQLMEPGLRPQDAASFERLLLASPNSSLLWLQYMANHLQATQIEQARSVAERALKTISFREEQEKLNVWVALLNLENMYGSEESLKKVFERAQTFCEPMPVYQQLADIYARSNKMKEAESLYRTMVKRFRQQKGSWLSYGGFLLQQGQSDAASALLQRALQSLPSTDSVELISKFAQLEYQYGDTERGRAMMDKILGTYPKRTDLWSVFMDLTIKHGSQKDVRALFDRAIHLSVAIKKVKFFFKRYLDYEKKHGTPESVQTVKEKALEFVEAKGTQAALFEDNF